MIESGCAILSLRPLLAARLARGPRAVLVSLCFGHSVDSARPCNAVGPRCRSWSSSCATLRIRETEPRATRAETSNCVQRGSPTTPSISTTTLAAAPEAPRIKAETPRQRVCDGLHRFPFCAFSFTEPVSLARPIEPEASSKHPHPRTTPRLRPSPTHNRP
jgi:hypothetical protein